MSKPALPAAEDKPRCRVCDGELQSWRSKRCAVCKSAQGEPCVVCGERLPEKAHRCNACHSYQGGRRHFAFPATVISLLAAVIGVISGAASAWFYIRDFHSHTTFRVTGSQAKVLYMKVLNTGKQPSRLLHYTLNFGSLPIEDVSLEVIKPDQQDAKNVVMPGAPVKLGLWIPDFVLYRRGTHLKYSGADIKKLFSADMTKTSPFELTVDIEESDDPAGAHLGNLIKARPFHTGSDKFPADWASDFIQSNNVVEGSQ